MDHPHARLRFSHGPDADDAFVFEPLINGRIDTDGLRFEHRHLPFDQLNRDAAGDAPPDVTMMSAAALARLTDRWVALPFGGSFVRTMGPMVVAPARLSLRRLRRSLVAVPGELTTANLLLRLTAPEARTVTIPYDRIAASVADGVADAGVVIHEGQIDFERHGLVKVMDLGVRWMRRHRLPTPLAVCAIRADLPLGVRRRVVTVLQRSLESVRRAPTEALRYAEDFTGGLGAEAARLLVDEYVSDDTYHLGDTARRAIEALIGEAQALDRPPVVEFAGAA